MKLYSAYYFKPCIYCFMNVHSCLWVVVGQHWSQFSFVVRKEVEAPHERRRSRLFVWIVRHQASSSSPTKRKKAIVPRLCFPPHMSCRIVHSAMNPTPMKRSNLRPCKSCYCALPFQFLKIVVTTTERLLDFFFGVRGLHSLDNRVAASLRSQGLRVRRTANGRYGFHLFCRHCWSSRLLLIIHQLSITMISGSYVAIRAA